MLRRLVMAVTGAIAGAVLVAGVGYLVHTSVTGGRIDGVTVLLWVIMWLIPASALGVEACCQPAARVPELLARAYSVGQQDELSDRRRI